MKTSALMALSFVCGAVVGASIMALYNKRKTPVTENEAKEEQETTAEPLQTSHSEEAKCFDEPTLMPSPLTVTKAVSDKAEEYIRLAKQYGGTSDQNNVIGPYVISEEDFDEYEDYGSVFLTYYADGVLADEGTGEKVEDIDNIVGNKFVNYFGSFGQPDLVCIRNDERKCDYHITKSLTKWSTVDSESPHMKWR